MRTQRIVTVTIDEVSPRWRFPHGECDGPESTRVEGTIAPRAAQSRDDDRSTSRR